MKKTATSTNLFYYAGIISLFLLLKLAYSYCTNDHLLFLLAPTNAGIKLLTASTGSYTVTEGFFHRDLHIIIDRSCSGFNFWLLAFSMLTISTVHCYKSHIHKLLACTCLLVISYIVTVFVNISRISVALFTLRFKNTASLFDQAWMHEAQGAFIYLLFLVLLYLGIQSITAKLTKTNAYTH